MQLIYDSNIREPLHAQRRRSPAQPDQSRPYLSRANYSYSSLQLKMFGKGA